MSPVTGSIEVVHNGVKDVNYVRSLAVQEGAEAVIVESFVKVILKNYADKRKMTNYINKG